VSAGLVLRDGVWTPFDEGEDLGWREEAFGERPVLGPWGDPFHGPGADEVLECGLETPEVCESCQ
jgi:hypothetical protein